MNAVLRFAVPGLLLAGLSACASTSGNLAATDASGTDAVQVAQGEAFLVDAEYMAKVEYLAARRGVDVRWVHPPERRVAKR